MKTIVVNFRGILHLHLANSHVALFRHNKKDSHVSSRWYGTVTTECVLVNFCSFQNTQRRSELEKKVIIISRFGLFNIFQHPILVFSSENAAHPEKFVGDFGGFTQNFSFSNRNLLSISNFHINLY